MLINVFQILLLYHLLHLHHLFILHPYKINTPWQCANVDLGFSYLLTAFQQLLSPLILNIERPSNAIFYRD